MKTYVNVNGTLQVCESPKAGIKLIQEAKKVQALQETQQRAKIVGFVPVLEEKILPDLSTKPAKVVGMIQEIALANQLQAELKTFKAKKKLQQRREKQDLIFRNSNLKGLLDLKRTGGKLTHSPFQELERLFKK